MKKSLIVILIVCFFTLNGGCAWEKLSGNYNKKENPNVSETENADQKDKINPPTEEKKSENTITATGNDSAVISDTETIAEEETEQLDKELESLFITSEQFYSRGLEYANNGKWDLAEEEFENSLELLHNSPIREKYPEQVNNFYNELSLEILERLEQNEESDVKTREEILLAQIRAKPEQERTIKEKVTLDLREMEYDVPVEINDLVIRYIEYYTIENKEKFKVWLERSGAYMPILRKIFREEGLPLDLTYLPIIESAFKTSAYSRARAAGLWQFIPGTGKKYGLRITWWVDERRDFEKSTRSAAKYLKFLFGEFNSWNLALAGYNAGEGRVQRAIRYTKTDDFWKLRTHLPRETRNYVPAFLASVIVAKNPGHYGLDNVKYEKPIIFEKISINRSVPIENLAKCANTSKEEIKRLNPEIRYWATPPTKNYTIRIPEGTAKTFAANFEKVKDTYSLAWNKYKVRRGDSLYIISRNFGVPVAVIAAANNIRNPRLIRVGQTILMPNKWSKEFSSPSGYSSGELAIHLVRRGETLSHIAKKYGTSVSSIMRWNNLTSARRIYPNQKLKVYAGLTSSGTKVKKVNATDLSNSKADESGKYITHSVRRGENLWLISKKYGVSISGLMKWNGIRYANKIRPGQSLKVYIESKPQSSGKKYASSQNPTTSPQKTEKGRIHIVRKGDSLWSISKQYGVSVNNLKKWNGLLYSNRITPGDKIRIFSSMTSGNMDNYIVHNVRKGENLWVIARRYGVSIANIMEWNNISSASKIRPSQKLKIYKNI